MKRFDLLILTTCLALATCNGQLKDLHGKQYSVLDEAQVSVKVHGKHVCGGTLISPTHVLTAAHCIDEFLKLFHVKTIPTMSVEIIRSGQVSRVATFARVGMTNNPGKNIPSNAVGLVKLVDAIRPLSDDNVPKLMDNNIELPPNFNIKAIASESIKKNLWHETRSVTEFKVLIVHPSACRAYHASVGSDYACAILKADTKDCQGMIGHPIVYDGEIFGVITHTNGKCYRGSPILFSKIYKFVPSINEAMKNAQKCYKPKCYDVESTVARFYASENDDEWGLQKVVRPVFTGDTENLRNPANFWGPK